MPFGLTNAPATIQRLMESCLGELHLNWCIIYLDDIIVFTRTPEEHLHRLKAVTEWPQPTTVTEVRSFLGFVSYYRRFIPNFSKVAKPLNKLLQNLGGDTQSKEEVQGLLGARTARSL